tara:strand:- start:9186 stop:9443 length:258 start_codon:yes stop_codon:yes gene_type:complete
MTTTFKMPEPVTRIFFDELCGTKGFYKVSQVQPCMGDFPVYSADALRDVLEQAAQECETQEDYGPRHETPRDCAVAIRAMKEQIQ